MPIRVNYVDKTTGNLNEGYIDAMANNGPNLDQDPN